MFVMPLCDNCENKKGNSLLKDCLAAFDKAKRVGLLCGKKISPIGRGSHGRKR